MNSAGFDLSSPAAEFIVNTKYVHKDQPSQLWRGKINCNGVLHVVCTCRRTILPTSNISFVILAHTEFEATILFNSRRSVPRHRLVANRQ